MSLLTDLELAMVHIEGRGVTMRVHANRIAHIQMFHEAQNRLDLSEAIVFATGFWGGTPGLHAFHGVEIEDIEGPDYDAPEPIIRIEARDKGLFHIDGL